MDIEEGVYTFSWEGSDERAKLVDDVEDERIRFVWEDADEGEYLEFRMEKSPVTGETVLELTDFADSDEVEDQKQLWESQFKVLRQETGG